MSPFYELMPTASGRWLLCRTMDGCPVIAEFMNKKDAQRALNLFEQSERQTKSLIDPAVAKKAFDTVMDSAKKQAGIVSGYDHSLE